MRASPSSDDAGLRTRLRVPSTKSSGSQTLLHHRRHHHHRRPLCCGLSWLVPPQASSLARKWHVERTLCLTTSGASRSCSLVRRDVLDGTMDLIVSEDCHLSLLLGVRVSHHARLNEDGVSSWKSWVIHWFSHRLIPTPLRTLFGLNGHNTHRGKTRLRMS